MLTVKNSIALAINAAMTSPQTTQLKLKKRGNPKAPPSIVTCLDIDYRSHR